MLNAGRRAARSSVTGENVCQVPRKSRKSTEKKQTFGLAIRGRHPQRGRGHGVKSEQILMHHITHFDKCTFTNVKINVSLKICTKLPVRLRPPQRMTNKTLHQTKVPSPDPTSNTLNILARSDGIRANTIGSQPIKTL